MLLAGRPQLPRRQEPANSCRCSRGVPAGSATLAIATQRCNGRWKRPSRAGAGTLLLAADLVFYLRSWLYSQQCGAPKTGGRDATPSADPPGDWHDLWNQAGGMPIAPSRRSAFQGRHDRPGAAPPLGSGEAQPLVRAQLVAPPTRKFSFVTHSENSSTEVANTTARRMHRHSGSHTGRLKKPGM